MRIEVGRRRGGSGEGGREGCGETDVRESGKRKKNRREEDEELGRRGKVEWEGECA